MMRGSCPFTAKAALYQSLGAAAIVVGNNDRSTNGASFVLRMGPPAANITIPSVFISTRDYMFLVGALFASPGPTLGAVSSADKPDPAAKFLHALSLVPGADMPRPALTEQPPGTTLLRVAMVHQTQALFVVSLPSFEFSEPDD